MFSCNSNALRFFNCHDRYYTIQATQHKINVAHIKMDGCVFFLHHKSNHFVYVLTVCKDKYYFILMKCNYIILFFEPNRIKTNL